MDSLTLFTATSTTSGPSVEGEGIILIKRMSFHFVKKATKSTIEQTGRRSIGFLTFALECMFNCVQSLLLFYFSAQVRCAACKTSSVTNTVYAERAAAL